jgi:hypothetical protein
MANLSQDIIDRIELSFHIPENPISRDPFVVRVPLKDFSKTLADLHTPYLLRAEFIRQAIGLSLLYLTSQGKHEGFVRQAQDEGSKLCLKSESLRLAKHMQIILDSVSEDIDVLVTNPQLHSLDDEDQDDGA